MNELVSKYNMKINGILHIGAHECEELLDYMKVGVKMNNIHWVEGNNEIYNKMKEKKIPNLYYALIDEKDNNEVIFNIASNGQSSSILEFGSHSINHPHVKYINNYKCKTKRIDTLIDENNIPIESINFLNLDIQGVELRAMKSMEKYLQHIDYIYTEVNVEEVYKNCDNMYKMDEYLKQFGFIRKDARIYQQYGWGDAIYIKE